MAEVSHYRKPPRKQVVVLDSEGGRSHLCDWPMEIPREMEAIIVQFDDHYVSYRVIHIRYYVAVSSQPGMVHHGRPSIDIEVTQLFKAPTAKEVLTHLEENHL